MSVVPWNWSQARWRLTRNCAACITPEEDNPKKSRRQFCSSAAAGARMRPAEHLADVLAQRQKTSLLEGSDSLCTFSSSYGRLASIQHWQLRDLLHCLSAAGQVHSPRALAPADSAAGASPCHCHAAGSAAGASLCRCRAAPQTQRPGRGKGSASGTRTVIPARAAAGCRCSRCTATVCGITTSTRTSPSPRCTCPLSRPR